MKLALNFTLVAIPELNIQAAPVGTLACYAFVLFAGTFWMVKSTNLQLSAGRVFGKPFFAAICCGASAWAANGLLERVCGGRLAVLGAIAAGGLVYLAVVLLTRTITRADVLMLPGGEKFAKLLEKRSLLG